MPPRYKRPPGEGRLIQLVYYAFVGGSALARALPERLSYGLARAAGRISARISKKRDQVRANLSRTSGLPIDSQELDRLVVKAYQSYARYWLETFSLVREDQDFFLDRFRSPNQDRLFGYVARGKGAIVVVGHLGNWDAAGAWVGANGHLLVTVAEVLKPRRMFDFFVAHRAKLGMVIHPAERGATLKLAEAVENGAVVAILGDRDLKGRGPVVEFFGEKVPFPAGPASVALEDGSPGLHRRRLRRRPRGREAWLDRGHLGADRDRGGLRARTCPGDHATGGTRVGALHRQAPGGVARLPAVLAE